MKGPGIPRFRGLVADLRHAARLYLTTPLASFIAVAVLAVAMAVLTAFLSLWSDLTLEADAGFERSRELVTIGQNDGDTLMGLSWYLVERVDAEVGSLTTIAGSMTAPQRVDAEGDAGQLLTELVTVEYFGSIRPRLALGRGFDERDHDAGAAPVAVISYDYWQERYGGDAQVIGRTLRARGPNFVIRTPDGEADASRAFQDYRIVGVMARGVTGTFFDGVDVWVPYEQAAEKFFGAAGPRYRRFPQLRGVGRLAPGNDAADVATELEARYGGTDNELGVLPNRRLDAMAGLVADVNAQREVQRQVRLFLAGSVLLALVAACNVSLFLLSRAPGRHRELGTRMAVGAPLKRLARQLASEAAVLVVAATLSGVLASLWLAVFLRDLPFLRGPFWRSVSPLDWQVLAIVAVVMLAFTLLVSLAPIAGLRRLGIAQSSRVVPARAGWAQRLAGTAQLAVAAVIAAAAVAFGWYLLILTGTDRGFDVARIHLVSPELENPRFDPNADPEQIVVERERRRAAVAALPGVESVAFGTSVPGREGASFRTRVNVPDASGPDGAVDASIDSVGHAFTSVLGMTIVHGRELDTTDRNEVLVNETLARAVWGRTDVAGESLPVGPMGWPVAGVVRDVSYGHPAEDVAARILHPAMAAAWADGILIAGDLTAAEIREHLQSLIDAGELDFEIADIERLGDLVSAQLAGDRARTLLTVGAAALVIVLAAFGFYGTQRYLVAASRREFAIRAALGAGPRALGRLVVKRGLALAAPGLVLGVLLAFVLVAWLRGEFVSSEVSPYVVAVVVAAAIAGLVLGASLEPARRARRLRAGLVLREE